MRAGITQELASRQVVLYLKEELLRGHISCIDVETKRAAHKIPHKTLSVFQNPSAESVNRKRRQ